MRDSPLTGEIKILKKLFKQYLPGKKGERYNSINYHPLFQYYLIWFDGPKSIVFSHSITPPLLKFSVSFYYL